MLLCLLHEIEFRSEVGKLDGLHADGEILGRLDAGVFVGKGNGKRREAFHVRAAGEAAVPMGRSTETRALLRTSGTVNSVPSLLASVTG